MLLGTLQHHVQVLCWFGELRLGHTSLKGDKCTGRLSTAVTEENAAAVKRLVKEDPRLTDGDIEESLKVSSPERFGDFSRAPFSDKLHPLGATEFDRSSKPGKGGMVPRNAIPILKWQP